MITPVVSEPAWEAALQTLPGWKPAPVPTVVIAPHPDDETLAAGGLIAMLRGAGIPVSVIAVTDGENAYDNSTGLGPLREVEQTQALARLGVSGDCIHRLRIVDSSVARYEPELTTGLRPLLQTAGHVVAPWPHDFHPDHEACGRAAKQLASEFAIPLTFYFFWTWHRGTPALLEGLNPVRLHLTPAQQFAKREALACHVSQLEHASGAPILPADLLAPAWRPYEVFLPA